ncbi:hypothetical protein TNCV_1626551 [Trichonephila clavipes]|nr:hypothetical protein TNCV_1626551 [Trichonephila clavipes]
MVRNLPAGLWLEAASSGCMLESLNSRLERLDCPGHFLVSPRWEISNHLESRSAIFTNTQTTKSPHPIKSKGICVQSPGTHAKSMHRRKGTKTISKKSRRRTVPPNAVNGPNDGRHLEKRASPAEGYRFFAGGSWSLSSSSTPQRLK